jgi:hypothetical protein
LGLVLEALVALLAAAQEQVCQAWWGRGFVQGVADGLGGEWMRVFHTPLADYDALLVLRKEALPEGGRVVPGAPGPPHSAHSVLGDAANQPPPKRARAVLRALLPSERPIQMRVQGVHLAKPGVP